MIQCVNVVKAYGAKKVLDSVSISFDDGRIHGIMGRNGSGKTMLFKAICGLIQLTSGSIHVNGKMVKSGYTPDQLSAIIERPGFLPYYSGYKNLKMLASINGNVDNNRIRDVIKLVGLDPTCRKWVSKYSMGMKQRLGIAQAIMDDSQMLILDEPLNGLDKSGVKDMHFLFRQLREHGKTIVLASHNPLDMDELCDTVYEMDAGAISRLR